MPSLQLVLSILCLVSRILAANLPRLDSQSVPQPAPGKSYYTIFPKNNTDTSKTGDFIKQIVGTEDLLPWTDVEDQLMHWTVEASPEQVSQLQGNTGIDHVDEFHPQNPPATTLSIRDTPAETPAEKYMVFAKDGKNEVKTNQTEQFLQNLVGKQNVRPPFIFKVRFVYWLCIMTTVTVTTSQSDEAAKNPGVKSVGVVQKVAKFLNVKVKRAVSYSAQNDAVTELVEVSQPSTIPDVKNLKNYVYESNSGKNSFVYHIEGGVAFKKQSNEFPNVVPDDQHLQTDIAKDHGIHPWEDPLNDSHGTYTASKAVSKDYGVAKQAKHHGETRKEEEECRQSVLVYQSKLVGSKCRDVPPGTPLPNEGDCEKHFLEITDGCDGNDPNNPANYKGGGVFKDGNYKYHIDPQAPRQPASDGKKGGCDSSYKVLYNECTLWGHGWDSADYGEALEKEVKGCALLPDTWSFSYGMGDDGREWTAKFRTGVFQKKCTGHAGKTASGIDNFGCSGIG
ncbi:uncharacterized protein PAC_15919 [Phialocephala subalpina]|uniref:Uncharacterized protein n=1 Tax=Phialocephala subalpina TaxID=576137 RepID=A0A1L7XLV8_9HELO|nr:uncharacterized protein PAC_15919 [Phialocephala subalpina]